MLRARRLLRVGIAVGVASAVMSLNAGASSPPSEPESPPSSEETSTTTPEATSTTTPEETSTSEVTTTTSTSTTTTTTTAAETTTTTADVPGDDGGGVVIFAVIPGAVTGVNVVETSVSNGNTSMRMNINWFVGLGAGLGGSVQAGDTFAVTLDPQLRATNGTFSLTDGDGNVVATVTISGTNVATFTLTDYVEDRLFTQGSAFFTVRFRDSQTPAGVKNLTFQTDSGETFTDAVEVRNQYVPAPPRPPSQNPSKSGSFTDAGQRAIRWSIYGAAGPATEAVITDPGDSQGPAWDINCSTVQINPSSLRATAVVTCDPDSLSVTVSNVPAGVRPNVVFTAPVTDPSLSGDLVFINTATVLTDGVPTELRSTLRQTNGGQGAGPTRPRTPSVVQSTCVNDAATDPTVTLPLNGGGITYSLDGTVARGETVTVTAELSQGYTWESSLPEGWTRVDANTATYQIVLDDPQCLEAVALTAPAVEQPVCLEGDVTDPTVTPTPSDGIVFSKSGSETPGGTVVVTATLDAGYRFPDTMPDGWTDNGNGTATYTVELANPDCDEIVTLAPPTVVQPACPDGVVSPASVVANETDGLTFTTTGEQIPGEEVTVTATVQPGYAFPTVMPDGWTNNGDGTATYTLTLDSPVCDEIVELTAPAIEYPVCREGVPVDPTVTPTETDGLVFTTEGTPAPGETVTVTATVQPGFTFPATMPDGWTNNGDGTASYSVTFEDPDCDEIVTLAPPAVVQPVCVENEPQQPSVTPIASDGLTFTQSGSATPGGTVEIIATLQADYQFPSTMPEGWTNNGDGTATYTVVLDPTPECLEAVALAAPTVTEPACQNRTLTDASAAPVPTDGIVYTTSGEQQAGGTTVVTATLDAGYRFPDTMPAGWTDNGDGTATYSTTFGDPACPGDVTLVVPAVVDPSCVGGTPTNPSITPVPADGITYTEVGDEVPGGTVTITATLIERWQFADELPAGWTDNGDGTATFTTTFPTPSCVAGTGGTLPATR